MSNSVPPPWALDWLPAGTLIGGYRLEERLGQGGMAVVFLAYDGRLNRRVALKLLAPGLAGDEAFRRRFAGESLAAAEVDDPHIIPVFEAGEADGVLFIAMRYVSGGDAASLVHRNGPLSPLRTAAIISPVASALDAAHAAGLVHRDVKPANMLLDVRPGRPDHVYLSDFGLSKGSLAASGLTGTGQFIGTLDYMSPEQLEGRPVDGRADQYALACAAFELLTGEPPFQRDQGLAVLFAHLNAPPAPVGSRRPDLPARTDDVFARALAKAPSDRFASCGDFAEALRAALGLPLYDAGSVDGSPPRAPGPATAGSATANVERATVPPQPRPEPSAPVPSGLDRGQPTQGAAAAFNVAAYDLAAPNPDRAPRRRPIKRLSVIAAAGAVIATAVIAAVIISRGPAPGTVYVASAGSGTVTPIDVATGHPGPPIRAGNVPDAIAITPDGKTAYVASYGSNGTGDTVLPIDLATGRAGTAIHVGKGPDAIAITPDGKTAYVANYGDKNGSGDTMTPIDVATGHAGTPIRVGSGPWAIAITPDGKTAYVANYGANGGNTVTPIDLATGRAGTPIRVGSGPDAIAITPGGAIAITP